MHFSVYYTYQKWFLLEIIFGKYAPRQFHNQIYTDTTEFFFNPRTTFMAYECDDQ